MTDVETAMSKAKQAAGDRNGPEHIELERARILEGEDDVTHMHYRVRR